MDIELTSDQRTFRDTTREFLEDTSGPARIRRLAEQPIALDRRWWSQAAELGWTALLAPESIGGGSVSGRPLTDLSLIATEIGRLCAPGPLASSSAVIVGLGAEAERYAATIEGLVTGELLGSWATYAPEQGWDPWEPCTTATPAGSGYVVNGVKDRVESGEAADVFLVSALSPDGPIQLLVPRETPGLTVTPTWSLDAVRTFSRLDLDAVEVGPAQVLHVGTRAEAVLGRQLQVAATLAAAEMCGATQAMFDTTLQWMFDRYSFGRPLASYQALKHRMADNKTWLEAGLAITAGAAWAVDEEASGATEMVSAAKAFVGGKAPAIIQDAVQLHGGLGVTWEHDLHLFLRRVVVDSALFGTPEEHRQWIATIVGENAA